MTVVLSIRSPLVLSLVFHRVRRQLRCELARARGRRDVHRGEDAEDIGLHHAGKQAEHRHDDRKDEGCDRE